MSKAVVSTMQASFARSMGLMREFIKVCPDEIWNKKFGGWPIWQQVYHALWITELFTLDEGAKGVAEPCPTEVGTLKVQGEKAPGKTEMLNFADLMETAADGYIEALDDAKLAEPQKGLSAKFGAPMNHAAAMGLLSGHIMYHLGSCDAALREHGFKGVF